MLYVENGFLTSRVAHGSYQLFDIACDRVGLLPMMWFITNLKCYNCRIIFVSQACVGICMVQKLIKVILLCGNGVLVSQAGIFAVLIGKTPEYPPLARASRYPKKQCGVISVLVPSSAIFLTI